MSKKTITLAPDLKPDRRKSRLLPIACIFVLASLMAPLVMEAVAVCYSQWSEVMGTSARVRTPIMDSIEERIQSVREDLWYAVSSRFQRVPWNPKVVLPIAAVIMALAMVMLRV
jgi:hypothetical protein